MCECSFPYFHSRYCCICRCDRLGLKSLAYLWRREQGQLLDEMISSGLTAILVKVAAIGGPLSLSLSHIHCVSGRTEGESFGVHLARDEAAPLETGESLVLSYLLRHISNTQSQRFGVHMCGEGGEYETLTLDCPLFTHTIVM